MNYDRTARVRMDADFDARLSALGQRFAQDRQADRDLVNITLDSASGHVVLRIRAYRRGFELQSRFRDDELVVWDLERYERALIEEWGRVLETLKDEQRWAYVREDQ